MTVVDIRNVAKFAYEAGQLKRLPRAGWQLAGVGKPESVAEHSFRVGVLAYVIAVLEGADADRAAALGLFHDLPEARLGDVPSVGRPYVTTVAAHEVTADQVAGLPDLLARHIVALVDEHESAKAPGATAESRCSRDADKLECLLQAREYAVAGNTQVQPWIDTMVAAIVTDTGEQLAAAALEVAPGTWWAEFAANYGWRR